MKDLSFDLETLSAGYRTKAFALREVAAEALRRIAEYGDPAVWITRVAETDVLARAAALQADELNGALPLYGIPFAVKDNIDAAGLPTTAACPAFAFMPEESAAVVVRLLAAGAILLGKTNLDQFATGLVGTRSPYGAPRCVFDGRYISGGSSAGSAVAVAAGLVSFALGTDTAGSGRVPAGFNNIVGLKPTRGLLSTRGVVPACRSLDCVSIFAGSVGEADHIMRVAEGFDAEDPFSVSLASHALPDTNLRVGVLPLALGDIEPDMAALYEGTLARLVTLGATPVEIDFAPFAAVAQLLYDGPWIAERQAAIKDFMAAHEADMDPVVRQIIAHAPPRSAVEAFEGQYRLAALKRKTDAEWARMDVLLVPTAPAHFTIEEIAEEPIARNAKLGTYTNFVNLLNCCAVALPAGFRPNGLPFGITLIAPGFTDHALARLADRLQRVETFGVGLAKKRSVPMSLPPTDDREDQVDLFVVGAHLSGMPLNKELLALGGTCEGEARTAPGYRFFVLPGTAPPKPGLLRAPQTHGPGILGEVWTLSPAAFGAFVSRIPAPLGIGKVALADGRQVSGFLCEAYALEGAEEITDLGGWRRYIASKP
jgi:allophanate hydrolase